MKIKKALVFLIPFIVSLILLLQCDNPFGPPVPRSLIGKWKLVRNDAMKRDGTYDHDSPVGVKCPQFWEITNKAILENTTMMEAICSSVKCDTLEYCYMSQISRELTYGGGSDIKINGRLYRYQFKGDTLVIIDDIKRNPNIESTCCDDIVYHWHYAPYTGNIPPDDSPCVRCAGK
jgi:hypothetical protein